MSLLSDTFFSGASSRLHVGRGRNGCKTVRKSQSHGGFLSPLAQLVRDPVGTLGGITTDSKHVPDKDGGAVEASRRQVLYLHMKDAETYDEWKAAATELDILEGNEAWKELDDSTEYNAELVAARLKELDDARMSCDVKKMLFLIRTTLTRGLGDMGQLSLYKHSHIGTKRLIERYIESAQQTLAALLDISEKQGDECPVEPRRLVDQLLQTRQSFGRSALLLSGGGTFGMNHIGVISGLWDARLLPRIISGASAGSIVSAVLCTRTDAEIPEVMHQFCYGDLNVFGDPNHPDGVLDKAMRLMKSGVLFDISHLTRVMRDLLGDMTFQEAYNRTRRILNIPVSSSSLYELPRLLNYITAPNVMIWSAVCTSCSVPLVYKKASLLAKDPKTGAEVPWNPNPNATWIDGSVDNDLPMTRLAEMFNVNHFIVSQVNPHVIPFLAKEEEIMTAEAEQRVAAGSSWVSLSASLCKGEVMHRLQQIADTGIFPTLVTKGRSILSQRYSGDINIFPKINYADFPKVLSNPTPEYMKGCMLTGQRATWPKLSRIQNHVAIELALDDTIQKLKGQLVFSPSQQELTIKRTTSQGDVLSHRKTTPSYKMARFTLRTEPPSPVFHKSAPTSPRLSRPGFKSFSQSLFTPTQIHVANRSKRRSAYPNTSTIHLDPASSTNSTSDQDYFADPDSDTTTTNRASSSPSPLTSPTYQVPTLWPSTPPTLMRATTSSQADTPPCTTTTTPVNRRTSTILNLAMTSATSQSSIPNAPSSPELRYKRLFHPPGPATPDVSVGPPVLDVEPLRYTNPSPGSSRPGSRRGSGVGLGLGVGDHSGTRGMLLRKKSFL
ncbi:triacylglycerol lipase [Pyrenophora tritici-repentis]|uniref:Patatin-like phospholipase domain-containing protein n=2 Tax=Pyrenophora tritici-repentis TaxID=45151 RepID=A0A834RHW3_9PLEO|nr:triacylglycerol lipase [Pyrenophora tritici-repentis Pt-1C-BFP]KAF7564410.1 RssA, esterase alpha-beta hydrolase superfamily [Pyrenophora tritici-repentis]EDU50425.1 triacylglycerol lipase [Pyrenophora tritici-repentis Pt-1C-BFP]KAI0583534.1 triacylglycerol lipase [Pyrenophora tritici-repentis]KAI0605669.1 triacylglycerol lipase [Pyrenophora tritici-repentis]KAI0620131.1 triacylglycerol lipase [Pyrenophora tritici-repentis]